MTLPTFNPPLTPSIGTTDTREFALLKLNFGDGYGQSTPNGINHIRLVRELTWEPLYQNERDAIVAFFLERAGYKPFLYGLDHDPDPIRFTCEKWSDTTTTGGYFRVSATFRQDFSLS